MSADKEIIEWLRGVIGNEQYYAQALINDKEVADKWEESSSGVLQTGSPEAQDQWAGCWPCGNSTLSRHIVLHDPVSALADCEAKLEMIRLCERVISDDAGREYWSDGWSGLAVTRMMLRYMAYGYRHAAGYRKEWQK